MSVRFDHAVVVVGSLADATREFTAAGFHVLAGGRHDAIPTENALVCFADGSYLELLAARDPATRAELRALRAQEDDKLWRRLLRGATAVGRRFLPLLALDDGVADWVLHTDALGTCATRLRRLGVVASGPVAMSRERAGGETLSWDLLLPGSPLYPFWIADRTPRERRVPSDRAVTTHANGARGVAAVHVRALLVPSAALALGDALGVLPAVRADGASVLDVGAWQVELVRGEREGASAVTLAGCGPLSGPVRALGVFGGAEI